MVQDRQSDSQYAKATADPVCSVDPQKVFGLIDRVLPFEACLYHAVLPLDLVDRKLYLGMVELTDVAALEYTRKIVSFLNYALIPQVIPGDIHHRLLSQYLQKKEQTPIVEEETMLMERPVSPGASPQAEQAVDSTSPSPRNPTVPVIQAAPAQRMPPPARQIVSAQETLILEAPNALDDWTPALPQENPAIADSKSFDRDATAIQSREPSADDHSRKNSSSDINPATGLVPVPSAASPVASSSNSSPDCPSNRALESNLSVLPVLPIPGDALPLLPVSNQPIDLTSTQITTMDSTELLTHLLGHALSGGIGRLHFEHQGNVGRVLSSSNGSIQHMIETLPIARFDSLIWALKQLLHVRAEVVSEVLQVEIERRHEQSRVLLRLRLIPKYHPSDQVKSDQVKSDQVKSDRIIGEEASLQILRGTALRFYQQQQSTQLRRDTLSVAQTLQQKVQALQNRSGFGSAPPSPVSTPK